uniref:Uncharacterized protein n=1 Tax=Alexandrium catenella TaxID=2925 RepID=A0A7S1S251_ALECA
MQMGSGLQLRALAAGREALPPPLCNAGMKNATEGWRAAIKSAAGRKDYTAIVGMSTCHATLGIPEMMRWGSMSLANAFALGKPAYEDGMISTVDGVFPMDAALCTANNFTNLPGKDAILSNYTAIMAMASQFCAAYGVSETTMDILSLEVAPGGYLEVKNEYDVQQRKPASQRKAPMLGDGLSIYNTLICKAGMMPCLIPYCLENFCTLSNGSIGMGCQCGATRMIPPASP